MRVMYAVGIRDYGCRVVRNSGPCEGLLDFPRSRWTQITKRPLGRARAIALADAQTQHAVVCVWNAAEKIHDNGKPPGLPAGWYPADAITANDPRRAR
jgi:hypothetical protein